MASLALAFGGLASVSVPAAPAPAGLELPGAPVLGRVIISRRDAGGAKIPIRLDVSQTVVYLVPLEHALDLPPTPERPSVSQKSAKFAPPYLVVIKGQTVDFPNDDKIDHNVFSFSRARKFDLGVYPKGQSKSVTFDQEGLVLIFCSVHEHMNGMLFVVPNPLYALSDAEGKFSIAGVPPGRYSVRTWNTRLPEGVEYVEVTEIDVKTRRPVHVDVDLGLAWSRGGDGP